MDTRSSDEITRIVGHVRAVAFYYSGDTQLDIEILGQEYTFVVTPTEYLRSRVSRTLKTLPTYSKSKTEPIFRYKREGEKWISSLHHITLPTGEVGFLEDSIVEMLSGEKILDAIKDIRRGMFLAQRAKKYRIRIK